MKMSQKMIVLFSLLALAMVIANSVYFSLMGMRDLDKSTAASLHEMGNRMVAEFEQYVQLMDYAADEVISNIDFMDSLYAVWQDSDRIEDINGYQFTQNKMSGVLYHSAINESFYRVSVYTEAGFFLSSRLEKNDTVASMSEEARSIVRKRHFTAPETFKRTISPPHVDEWTNAHKVFVFSTIQPALWHGKHIGYVEVTATTSELNRIFGSIDIEGLTAQVVMDDGTILFRPAGKLKDYSRIECGEMVQFRTPQGDNALVVAQRSKQLGLTVYAVQDMDIYVQSVRAVIFRYLMIAAIILLVALVIITAFSYALTRSIRRLTKKVRQLSVDTLLAHPERIEVQRKVTSRYDAETYELEQDFDELIEHLRGSLCNEITMREGNLQAQLNALQVQINPHFVYNTLNIVSAKGMESGNEEITEICNRFSQMLRYSTDLCSKSAPLADELTHVRCYLQLAKARYEERLEFEIDVPRKIESIRVPKLSLQPIVENALSYGKCATQVMRLQIRGAVAHNQLCLTIHDNGNGFDPDMLLKLQAAFAIIEGGNQPTSADTQGHIGLVNTYMRLFYYSRGLMRMRIYNNEGATVELTMPNSSKEAI